VARVELRAYVSDDDDPGREVLIPDVRIEKPKRKRAKKSKEGLMSGSRVAAMAAAPATEPLIVPLLIDDEIEEARLEITHLKTGALVTVIEVLSPTNKVRGARGRASFMQKRQEILCSDVHWVEIDLLRSGTPSVTRPPLKSSDYRILVSHAGDRARARYWPVSVRQPLPVIGIPLRSPDHDVNLDLGKAWGVAYERGAYDLSIDYSQPLEPPLRNDDAAWANRLLRERRSR
jgi:hypothetical protein